MRKAGDKAGPNRIATRSHNDGNTLSWTLCSTDRLRTGGNDDVNLQIDKLTGEDRKAICSISGRSRVDDNICSFDVAQIAQALAKCFLVSTGQRYEAYVRNFARLLCLGKPSSCQKDSCR